MGEGSKCLSPKSLLFQTIPMALLFSCIFNPLMALHLCDCGALVPEDVTCEAKKATLSLYDRQAVAVKKNCVPFSSVT